MEIIRLYNNALLDLCEIEPKGSRCMSLLLDYESLVRHGCEAYMKGCALIEIFRDTSSSIDVWARVAQLETNDLELKKQRIYTGIGIAKGQRSIRFERMLLALAPEIEKKFNRRRKISRGNLLHFDEEEEEFHYRQMERLVRIPDMLGTTEDYRSYIRYLVEQSVARAATKRSRVQKVALKERNQSGDAFYEFANSPTPKFEADNKKQLGYRVVWHARQATNGIQESQRAHKRQDVHPENFSRHDALNRQNNEFWLVHEKTTSLLIESYQQ